MLNRLMKKNFVASGPQDKGRTKRSVGGSYQGTRAWHSPESRYTADQRRRMDKRYSQFNAWSNGFNAGPRIDSFYNQMTEGELQLLPEGKMAIVDPALMIKADSPLTNADTGAFNAIFGAAAVIQYLQNANMFNSLSQEIWPSSGFRIVQGTPAVASGLGVAQSSDRPDTVEPVYLEVPVSPKEIALTTELSDVLVMQGETDDAVTFSVNKDVVHSNFMEAWDTDLLQDGDTLAGNNFESIDRAHASSTTATNLSWTAGDEDLYTIDRSTYTDFDAQSYDNSGTDRSLTRDLLDTAMRTAMQYGRNNTSTEGYFWGTGYDAIVDWEALEEAKQFLTTERATTSVGGVQTLAGQDGGMILSHYKGIPIIVDNNIQVDTISRVYLTNKEYTALSFGRPLEFLTNDNPFVVGFNVMGLWHAIGELRCVLPAANASIRDLE